nr:NYN domain-containing protein [Actinomycetota bacterium]
MRSVPDDIAISLARSLGAYIGATPAHELPGPLRRFKGFRQQTLATRHRADLLARLEHDALRRRLVDWLDDGKPSISKRDKEILRLACERPKGWRSELERHSRHKKAPPKGAEEKVVELEAQLERERAKVRKVREELKGVKESARAAAASERLVHAELMTDLQDMKKRVTAAERARTEAQAAAEKAELALERDRRKNRRAGEKAASDRDDARAELKEVRRTVRTLKTRIREVETEAQVARARRSSRTKTTPAPPGKRSRLRAPKGLFDDAPESLAAWLQTEGVRLLVDGYNVSKAEGAYGELDLESQRERVVDGVARLARKKNVQATVVFDGSEVPPRTSRKKSGPVTVEYSSAAETADDHLVALLEKWPTVPVIVVTSDRELQERAAAQGATIATSSQFMVLIR